MNPAATTTTSPSPTPTRGQRLRRLVLGKPRDVGDRRLFHRVSLVAFLAWVGLGADGLSSAAYGPEEAFRALGQHAYLAVGLAALTAFTVLLIAAAYRRAADQGPAGSLRLRKPSPAAGGATGACQRAARWYLCRSRLPSRRQPTMSSSDPQVGSHKLPDGATVLVADDDPVVRRTVRRMLELEQAVVVEARDGEHAIRIVDEDEAHLVDTVLTDLEMPVVSGAELIAVLQECRPDLPVAAMSGWGGLPPGLATVPLLHKPFAPEDLLGTLVPLVLGAREMRARARQARGDAAESRSLAERQLQIARRQHAACGELMAALSRLRQRM
jgi:CheY-like chemotaxis protein